MCNATGWTRAEVEQLPEAELETYLDLALRLRGVDPDKLRPTVQGAPPPAEGITPELEAAIHQYLSIGGDRGR